MNATTHSDENRERVNVSAEVTEPLPDVPTVADALIESAHRWPDEASLIYPQERVSFAELLEHAERYARALVAQGVEPGERVGILMPNCLPFYYSFFGAHLAGAVPVTVNARYKPKELLHVLSDADVVALLTTDLIADYAPFVDLLARAFADWRPPLLRTLMMLGESRPAGYVDLDSWNASADTVPSTIIEERTAAVTPRDTGVIMYTSGTTSAPRGCPLSQHALVRTATCVADRFQLTRHERFWNPLPLFHMAGLLPTIANVITGGASISLLHFDPDTAMRQLVEEGATFAYPAFPTITQSLIHHPSFESADLSRIRGVLDTALPDTLRQVQQAFPQAAVVSSYGLTEAGGVITYSHLDDALEDRVTTTGRPFPGMEVRIVDPETGDSCPAGVQGEIRVKGPGMFDGYLNDPAHTDERTDSDGYLMTGDLGTLDERGRITYSGRIKDMLKVGGENVAAAEIEAHFAMHPAVKIAAVVGVPDDRLVEVPFAFVELVPGKSSDADQLIDHCRQELASFKVPRGVAFLTEWPMSTTKIQKFRLRDWALEEMAKE